MRATSQNVVVPRGIGAVAQLAAIANTKIFYESNNVTLRSPTSTIKKKMNEFICRAYTFTLQ